MVFLDNIIPKSLFLLLHNGESLFLLCDTKYFTDYGAMYECTVLIASRSLHQQTAPIAE